MGRNDLSRRDLVLAGIGAGIALTPRAIAHEQQAPLKAADVVERIQKMVGIPWREKTVDKIIAGTPDTPVRGIATTMMATLSVLERAVAAGRNMVITHETPFYMHQDQTSDLVDDPTIQYKMKFIRDHGMVVFHFHDHWHARRPDGIAVGMMRELGWTKNADAADVHRFTFDGITLDRFVEEIQTRLQCRTMRVVGNPQLSVRRVLASWGFISRMPGIAQFREPGINVFIGGETREWELVEYAQDAVTRGENKALVLIGHIASEQAGMKYCAEWLRTFISEVPVEFVRADEPFWSPRFPLV